MNMYRLLAAAASGGLVIALSSPALALDLDLGVASVSVGGNDSGGLDANVGVDLGGSGGVQVQSNNTVGAGGSLLGGGDGGSLLGGGGSLLGGGDGGSLLGGGGSLLGGGGDGGSLLGGSDSLLRTNTSASVGGAVTADTDTSVLGPDGLVDSDSTANVLGTPVEADVNVGGGTGILGLVDPNVCIGSYCDSGGGGGGGNGGGGNGGGGGGNGGGGNGGGIPDLINGMSSAELARNRKLCRDILVRPNAFDRDLVGLCRMLQVASR